MKKEWKAPRINVQKFIPNEYASTICVRFSITGIIARLFQKLTDGNSSYENPFKGPDTGFKDDSFDFLAGKEDYVPQGEQYNDYRGWYSSQAPDTLKDKIVIRPGDESKIEKFTGGSWGNNTIPDLESTVYFWGQGPYDITANNHTDYDVGPNASW